MIEKMKKDGLVAILRNIPTEKMSEVLTILSEEGVKFVEITMNSKGAEEQIKLASTLFSEKLIIGAGTVNNVETLKRAMKNGANYFLTPGLNEEVLKYASEKNIPGVPGFTTVTEALMAMRYGFKFLKLFPAGEFPMSYLKSIKGPLDDLDCMAVGGVDESNVQEFFKGGYLAVGIGGNLIPKKHLEDSNWDEIRKNVREIRGKTKK